MPSSVLLVCAGNTTRRLFAKDRRRRIPMHEDGKATPGRRVRSGAAQQKAPTVVTAPTIARMLAYTALLGRWQDAR